MKIGDVVWLKSGGPSMVIYKDLEGGVADCQWFARETLQHGRFPITSLVGEDPRRAKPQSFSHTRGGR
jgi:uncharacterized protein YodC (DUF2158 family)